MTKLPPLPPIFKQHDPLKGKMLKILDEEGIITNDKFLPDLSDEQLLRAYRTMLYARVADLRAVSYQRQGRMYTFPPNIGQEAAAVGSGMAIREQDWLVPAFREMGAWLMKGAGMRDILLYWNGNEDGSRLVDAPNMFPLSVPIASHYPHATGIGYSIKLRGQDSVVFTYVGDGGTSQGDFHESLNFASVWKVPVVFTVMNNHYAISVPYEQQTASASIAIKSVAYGLPGIQVDGNDILAMYAASIAAREWARAGNGPTLIEAVTYRRGAHTTSDDPTRYRTKTEEDSWKKKGPLMRMKMLLISKGLWTEEQDKATREEIGNEIDNIFEEVESWPEYTLDDVFQHHYEEMPGELLRQREQYQQYLDWKEARR